MSSEGGDGAGRKKWSVASVAGIFGGSKGGQKQPAERDGGAIAATAAASANAPGNKASTAEKSASSGGGTANAIDCSGDGGSRSSHTSPSSGAKLKGGEDSLPTTTEVAGKRSSSSKHAVSKNASTAATPVSPTPSGINNFVESSKFSATDEGIEPRSSRGGDRQSSSLHKSSSSSGRNRSSTGSGGASSPPKAKRSSKVSDTDSASANAHVMEKLDSLFEERKSHHSISAGSWDGSKNTTSNSARGGGSGDGGSRASGGSSREGGSGRRSAARSGQHPTSDRETIPEESATEFHHESFHDSSGTGDPLHHSPGRASIPHQEQSDGMTVASSASSRVTVSRTPSDRSERARLKASLLGTFLDSKPKLDGGLSGGVDHDTRSTYTSLSKARRKSSASVPHHDKHNRSLSSINHLQENESSSGAPTVKEELMSFLSTLPKTHDKDKTKKEGSRMPSAAADRPASPGSPERGRRRKIGAMAASAVDPATAERRHRSRSRRARSKSRARASTGTDPKEDGGGGAKKSSSSQHRDNSLVRSRKEEKTKEPKKDDGSRDELRSSRRKSMKQVQELSPRKEASSRSLMSKSESPRKSSKQENISRRKQSLVTTPELQDSQGSIPSVEISPQHVLSPSSRPSRRSGDEGEAPVGSSGSSRRRSEVPRRKSEVSSTSTSRRAHKSDQHRPDRHKSIAPASVPENEGEAAPPTPKKRLNRHEELIASPAGRSKRSSSRARSRSRTRSSLTPTDMEIVTSPKSPSSKRASGRSHSVDPRKRRESSTKAAAPLGSPNAEQSRGRSRGTSGTSSSKSPSRGRSVSVGAKDRYSALLKNEEGSPSRVPKQHHFTELGAAEKLESSPGTIKAVASAPSEAELPSMPSMEDKVKRDSAPTPPSRASPTLHSASLSNQGDDDVVDYNEEDVFSFYSWSTHRQDTQKIQRERLLLRQSIRDTPLYRVFHHIHST